MSAPPVDELSCTVIGSDALPAELGGADELCRAIRAASRGTSGGSVVVHVKNASALTATVTDRTGRTHPAIGVSVSDATLKRQMVDKFAAEVARVLLGSS